ncbi:MAG: clostripain-related cysteine peptidase, partial [Candidatus Eremiobacterota bacterium]
MLVWSSSENDLYPYQVADLDEAERVGCSDTFQMVAQIDHGPCAQRLELKPDPLPGLRSPVKAELPATSMSCPRALADFIQWGMRNYPAEHYWLVVSDHGEGWKGACQDDGQDGWMTLPQLEEGLRLAREATGRKLDLLSFDACYMGSLEVAHQLRNEAGLMVGSEEAIGYFGLPYDRVLADMDRTPRELAARLVSFATESYEAPGVPDMPTTAAIDLSKVEAVTRAVRRMGEAVRRSPLDLSGVSRDTQTFWQFKDVHDLAHQIERRADSDPALREACQEVKQAVHEAVFAEQHAP